MTRSFLDNRIELRSGDCLDVVKAMPDCSVDSVVTDPPYALVSIVKRFGKDGSKPTRDGDVYTRSSAGFMGKAWDTGERAFAVEFWQEIYRVLKPGGHVAAFSGSRTYHRLAVAIEDSGFEIRDQLMWLYGSGFPKSHDVSKGIDKAAGAKRKFIAKNSNSRPNMVLVSAAVFAPRVDAPITAPATDAATQWQGWGTALKPAHEPIVLARKPLVGTVAANVLAHGTGAINIDGCRVEHNDFFNNVSGTGMMCGTTDGWDRPWKNTDEGKKRRQIAANLSIQKANDLGRWPANIIHDGSDEVVGRFPDDASRFFYTAKADAHDRIGSKHPTVKPVDLMQWLCRLITPKGGLILDPFAGTGTTGEAAWREGFRAILIEREPEYQEDIVRRMSLADAGPDERKRESIKARGHTQDAGPLFGEVA